MCRPPSDTQVGQLPNGSAGGPVQVPGGGRVRGGACGADDEPQGLRQRDRLERGHDGQQQFEGVRVGPEAERARGGQDPSGESLRRVELELAVRPHALPSDGEPAAVGQGQLGAVEGAPPAGDQVDEHTSVGGGHRVTPAEHAVRSALGEEVAVGVENLEAPRPGVPTDRGDGPPVLEKDG